MTWIVYILECGDGTLYTGMTNDLPKRLHRHRNNLGAKYTRGRQPLTLKYCCECKDRGHALKVEAQIKRLSRAQKLNLIGDLNVRNWIPDR